MRLTRRGTLRGAVGAALAALMAGRADAHAGLIHGHGQKAHRHLVHDVDIRAFRFQPARVAVRVGDTLRFANRDLAPHSATAGDGSWDTGLLNRGETADIEVTEGFAGAYICAFHPHMKGEVGFGA